MSRRIAALVAAAVLLVACNDDGRDLREPDVTLPPSTLPPVEEVAAIRLSSPAFVAGAALPVEFTCDGDGTSPPLEFGAIPPEVVELAVLVDDLDAGGSIHWLVAGIDPTVTRIDAGAVPAGAVVVENDFGEVGYSPPCPPAGEVHTYLFTLYGLTEASGIVVGAPAFDARITLGTATYSDVLSVFYDRPA